MIAPAYGDAFLPRVRELERREKAALTERVTAMSRLAAGLAHEIRNPLNSAHLQLELARRRLAKLPEAEAVFGPTSWCRASSPAWRRCWMSFCSLRGRRFCGVSGSTCA